MVRNADVCTATEFVDTSARRSVVGRNIAVLLTSQVVTWSLALVLTIALPRYLGPTGVGQLRLGASIWAVALVLAELGTSMLLTLEFARDASRASALLRPVMVLRLVGVGVATVAVAIFVAIAGYDLNTNIIIFIAGLETAILLFGDAARASLHGLQAMGATARADVATKVATVAFVVGVLVLGGRTRAVAVVMVLVGVMTCTLLWRSLRARAPSSGGLAVSPSPVGALRKSSPYLVNSVIVAVYASIDVVIISLLATPEEIGWYATAATLLGTLLFIPSATMTSLFPALAQVHAEDPSEVRRMLDRTVRALLLLGVPIGLGAIVTAESVAATIFGEDFRQAGPVIAVGGLAIILMFQTIVLGRFAFVVGKNALFNTVMFVATAMTIPLDLVLIPWTRDTFDNGAIGGGLSYVFTELFIMGMLVWKVAPHVLNRQTIVRLTKCALAGAALLASTWPLRGQLFVVPMIVGAITYAAAVILLRIPDHNEWVVAQRVLRRVRARLRHSADDAEPVGREVGG
jgi:O-antigen/teichoic acid export membrane protein